MKPHAIDRIKAHRVKALSQVHGTEHGDLRSVQILLRTWIEEEIKDLIKACKFWKPDSTNLF